MSPDVSRVLARFVASLGLSRESARGLATRFADIDNVADLPEWIREAVAESDPDVRLDPED